MSERAYIFDRTADTAEHTRLRALEHVFDPATQGFLRATGLTAGWRCLEVGAGAGSIAAWLGHAVCPSGSVLALDIDTRFLGGLRGPNLQICEADICAAGLAQSSVDLAHARFVLIHIPHWQGAFAAMLDSLRPGGWLVLEEPDFSAARVYAGPIELRRSFTNVQRAIAAMFRARGLDPAFGRRLPALFAAHGFEDIAIEHDVPIVAGRAPHALMMAASARQLADKYLATGRVDLADLERYAAFCAHPGCWAVQHATIRVRGRKPATGGATARGARASGGSVHSATEGEH